MTLHAFLHVVPGDEFLSTQSTDIWIVPSMTLHVVHHVMAEFEYIVTQKTIVFKFRTLPHR